MSTTTTITTEQLNEALNDYKIHLTGDSSRVSAPVKTEHHTASFVNPPSWPTDHYRIPPHRPVNRYLDLEQRPLGDNAMETAFLVVMFTGVVLNAVRTLNEMFCF